VVGWNSRAHTQAGPAAPRLVPAHASCHHRPNPPKRVRANSVDRGSMSSRRSGPSENVHITAYRTWPWVWSRIVAIARCG